MAVYERRYKRYTGALTPTWSRFLVLPRYAFQDVLKSRFTLVLLVASCFAPVLAAALIYIRHNAKVLDAFGLRVGDLLAIDASFFDSFLRIQGSFAFFLTLTIGPALVSSDLVNNALPLYLSRPFTKREYVLGKVSVLAILLSVVTWVPALFLFVVHSNLEGWGWAAENLRLAGGIFLASWVWILILGLMSLALSAWVRWRQVAAFLMLVLYFGSAVFGVMINGLLKTRWGDLLSLRQLHETLRGALLGTAAGEGPSPVFATLALVGFCAFFLWLLHRKIRAYEVVS